MKKVLLFASAVALTVSLNSCSSSSGGGSSMSMKINGTKKSFKTVAVQFGGTTSVFGYIGNADSPTEEVSFNVASGTGANKISFFSYDNATDSYDATTLTSNVSANTASSVKGTFSGTLEPFSGGTDLTMTEGTFSAKVTADAD